MVVVRFTNFAYTCKKFPGIIMTKQNIGKKHIVASYRNLAVELQDAIRAKYPLGFVDSMIRVDKPNGDFFYAVSFDTEDIAYLVKIDVKIDDNSQEEDDKDFYDEDIKGADEIQEDGNSENDDRDDYVSI